MHEEIEVRSIYAKNTMPKNDDDYGSVATRRQSHSTCCRKGGRKHPLKSGYTGPTATILAPARI
jgi:hypothetical protein